MTDFKPEYGNGPIAQVCAAAAAAAANAASAACAANATAACAAVANAAFAPPSTPQPLPRERRYSKSERHEAAEGHG